MRGRGARWHGQGVGALGLLGCAGPAGRVGRVGRAGRAGRAGCAGRVWNGPWASTRGAGTRPGRAAGPAGCALGALSLFLARFDSVLFLIQFLDIVREPGS